MLAPLGYRFEQPLAKVDRTLTRAYEDPILANLVTDALREATASDLAFTGNGTIRPQCIIGTRIYGRQSCAARNGYFRSLSTPSSAHSHAKS